MNIKSDKIAFVFPGQGSQIVGMGHDLADQFNICKDIFKQADKILGFELSSVMWNGPSEILNDTVNTQPALFVHSIAALKLFEQVFPEIKPTFIAGHSLGEISALVAAGSITFESGLQLVRKRGELMQNAGKIFPGGMAAILGMDLQSLEAICAEVSNPDEVVQIANDNCPGQIVISGAKTALDKAMDLAKTRGARKIRPLAVSIAAHSGLMKIAQEEFSIAIEKTNPFKNAIVPVISNVTAAPMMDVAELKSDILAQLTSRVRWTESIRFMVSSGVETIIEIGCGSILTGLIKRIDEIPAGIPFGTLDDLENMLKMDVSSNT